MTDLEQLEADLEALRRRALELRAHLAQQLLGQGDVLDELLVTVLAGGHALLEGAPGLGKTTLVRALAEGVDLEFRRVQCTPDLMPPDILGARILHLDEDGDRHFEFEPGPIFTHVLLADEINRATPRTQSALLEAMQESQVTVHGETHPLRQPFVVVATQNPIEMEGTYPLPEAQLDRFLMKIELTLPEVAELERVLAATTGVAPPPRGTTLAREDLLRLRDWVREVPASDDVLRLAAATVHATHPASELAPQRVRDLVRHGVSPRGGQALLLAGKARALLDGRLHVTVEDLERLVAPCLRHRLVLGYEAEAAGVSPDELAREAFAAARRSR